MTITSSTSFVKTDALLETMPASVRRIVGLLKQLQHGVSVSYTHLTLPTILRV